MWADELVVGHLQKGNMSKFMCRGDDWVTSDTLLSSWVPKRGFSTLLVSLPKPATSLLDRTQNRIRSLRFVASS